MASFALAQVAQKLGQEVAFAKFVEASALEEAGDCDGAIKLYSKAFKLWSALETAPDDESGLPAAVRREAEAAGIDCTCLSPEMPLDTQESPRFPVDAVQDWLPYLREQGYCVIGDVADASAVAAGKALLWDFLESVPETEVRRDDPSSWSSGWLANASNGILGTHGFGQSAFCWHARSLPAVRKAFETIWESKDVIASFDGGNAFRPWADRPEWKTAGGWWHVDQNSFLDNQDGFRCVQGLVTFTDSTASSGGLCVIPGSHKQHKEICERAYAHILKGHYVQVQKTDPVLAAGGRLVCAKAGDLVLWDSRCTHCNTPGVQDSGATSCDPMSQMSAELLRVVAYVCMTPTSWATEEVLEKRREGFVNNQTTDHIPHEWHGTDEALPWPTPQLWKDASFLQKRLVVGASLALADRARKDNDH